MVRKHRASGIIFPDRSWHTTLGPANASFRYGCVLNSDRTNLRRDHLYGHRTRPNYSVTIDRFFARITRRRLIIGADFRTGRSDMLSSFAVLIGSSSWSIGIVYSRSAPLHPDSRMAAAMSLLAGAGMLLLGGKVTGEAARLNLALGCLKSLLALGYLAIAGSLVAYSAYFWLLDRFPPTLIATHTYVNPLVALVLAWTIARQLLPPISLFAALLL